MHAYCFITIATQRTERGISSISSIKQFVPTFKSTGYFKLLILKVQGILNPINSLFLRSALYITRVDNASADLTHVTRKPPAEYVHSTLFYKSVLSIRFLSSWIPQRRASHCSFFRTLDIYLKPCITSDRSHWTLTRDATKNKWTGLGDSNENETMFQL